MGKLARLASVKSTSKASFAYLPPDTAYRAIRILLNCDVQQVGKLVLEKVLRGLRRASPMARILVVDRVCPAENIAAYFAEQGVTDLLDDNMRTAAVDELLLTTYPNQLENPAVGALEAPGYIAEYDSVLSLAVNDDSNPAAVNSLYGMLPCAVEKPPIEDLYFTIGYRFHGAIVELEDKVLWGDDLLAVDEAAKADVKALLTLRKALSNP